MSRIELQSHEDGVIVPVRARPAARKNAIDGVHDGAVRVSVTAAPEKGKANKAIAELLAKTLGVRKSDVRLLSGDASPQKRYLIMGTSAEDVRRTLRTEDSSA